MNRLLRLSLCILLAGCHALPPAPEPDVPSGAPWGLAWIPPSGEVAIRAGAVEHVLYPDATAQKPARAALDLDADWEEEASLSILRVRAAKSSPTQSSLACEAEHDAVPAWFLTRKSDGKAPIVKHRDLRVFGPKK